MANRSTRRKNKAIAQEILDGRRGNPDFRFIPPPRLNSPKDWRRNQQAPGFRKEKKEREIRVYKKAD